MDYFPEADGRPTAQALSEALLDFVAEQLGALARRHAPGLVLPRAFAGYPVGPDTRSDLAYTLGLLFEAGRKEIDGKPIEEAVLATLRALDGARTDTFYSYRAAESLLRLGGYHDNPRLADLDAGELGNLREAFDSSASAEPLRAGRLPVNYNVVVARCEHARRRLGLLDDGTLLDELLLRCRELVGRLADGWIDDSNEKRGQFDIYTADIFLFAEPLAADIGPIWEDGLRRVLADVDSLALPGGAIVWGRSIGALGLAMTIELAAIGVGRGLVDDPAPWLARAAWTLEDLRSWYSDGVIRAHQHRSTMFYRGPHRRLQMSLDILGKLVHAALDLRGASDARAATPAEAWGPVDRWVPFSGPGPHEAAGAWAHRSRDLSFVVPLIDGFSSDYLPAPRSPGLFESPTSGPIGMLPVIHRAGSQLVSAGVPDRVRHAPGELEVEYRGWAKTGADPNAEPEIRGGRRVRFRVEGRGLLVEEELEIDAEPGSIDAVALQVPALARRPLDVEFETSAPHRVNTVDVDGLAEYRSFWSELATVHQVDVDPARRLRLRWRVTPQLRVASTAHSHPYHDSLYGPLAGCVVTFEGSPHLPGSPRALRDVDVLHMHWPEWFQGHDVDRHRDALSRIRDAGVRILWTMHNLIPHRFRGEEAEAVYQLWAEAADAVVHHTEWGKAKALATYDYGPDTLHRVIPHGHWGARAMPHAGVDRGRMEERLGLAPSAMRLGVVGAPRAEKDVQLVLDAVHGSSNPDIQLLVVCLEEEEVPDDPRIRAIPASFEPEHVYYQRLGLLDALVLPFHEGMLMTGTAFDAIGAERAAIVSDWPVLGEVFGDAAIRYGATREDLVACLDALTPERLAASAAGMREPKRRTEWGDIAESTHALLEEIGRLPR